MIKCYQLVKGGSGILHYLYLFISFIADLAVHKVRAITASPMTLIRFVLIFVVIYAICLGLHILIMLVASICFDRRSHEALRMDTIFRKISMASLSLVIKLFRIKLTVNGDEKVPTDCRFLLVGNHRSPFDPITAMFYFRKYDLAFISKKENMDLPIVGKLMLACGCLPLDRENVRAAATTINDAAELIKSGIASVGIYPEGKVNQTDAPLLEFRNGAFKIAKKAKCPVVVTVAKNTNRVLKNWPLHSTEIIIDILHVFPAEEVAKMTTAQLGEEVWQMMYDDLTKE